jgi:hypothetical protein
VNVFRRLPTRQLALLLATAIVVAGSITAVAVAITGGGPVPPPKPLAQAVHDSLAGPQVPGVTASISFTNHLVDSSSLSGGGASPLINGATGRLWASNDGRLRLELQSGHGDTEIVITPTTAMLDDTSSNTVYKVNLPAHADTTTHPTHQLPTVQQIQDEITKLMQHVDLSGAIPSDVGGQPAYTVRISPKHSGGLLGSAELAWDANHGIPLRLAVYAQNDSTPVLELKATQISFGPVSASDLSVSPPPNAKVVQVAQHQPQAGSAKRTRHATPSVLDGISAVAAALPFKLDAPDRLAGLPRTSVKLLDWGGQKAALVTYGQRLGAILVVERQASATAGKSTGRVASLPAVQINGVSGKELETALGTAVWFSRGGIDYIVAGSVPRAAAEAAARGL